MFVNNNKELNNILLTSNNEEQPTELQSDKISNFANQTLQPTYPRSAHQNSIHSYLNTVKIDPNLFIAESAADQKMKISRMLQTIALPLYKRPVPANATRLNEKKDGRISLGCNYIDLYGMQKKSHPARLFHGTMHCVRVTLWTQILCEVYKFFRNEEIKNKILLATAGALHDVAREGEGRDYWDEESAEALKTLLNRIPESQEDSEIYVQAIREKDPIGDKFSTDEQRIVHDADCLDIMRIHRGNSFNPDNLCFYREALKKYKDPKDLHYFKQLIKEVDDFIQLTEYMTTRINFEYHSNDFYSELINLLNFHKKGNQFAFPILKMLLEGQELT